MTHHYHNRLSEEGTTSRTILETMYTGSISETITIREITKRTRRTAQRLRDAVSHATSDEANRVVQYSQASERLAMVHKIVDKIVHLRPQISIVARGLDVLGASAYRTVTTSMVCCAINIPDESSYRCREVRRSHPAGLHPAVLDASFLGSIQDGKASWTVRSSAILPPA